MSFKRPSHTFDIALIKISLSSSFIPLVQLFQTSNMYRTTKSQYAQTNPNKIVSQGVRERDLGCLLYTSPSPRDKRQSRMPSSA